MSSSASTRRTGTTTIVFLLALFAIVSTTSAFQPVKPPVMASTTRSPTSTALPRLSMAGTDEPPSRRALEDVDVDTLNLDLTPPPKSEANKDKGPLVGKDWTVWYGVARELASRMKVLLCNRFVWKSLILSSCLVQQGDCVVSSLGHLRQPLSRYIRQAVLRADCGGSPKHYLVMTQRESGTSIGQSDAIPGCCIRQSTTVLLWTNESRLGRICFSRRGYKKVTISENRTVYAYLLIIRP